MSIFSNSGPYGGMMPPRPVVGMAYFPYGYTASGSPFNLTANRVYYAPLPIFRTTTFSGFQFQDNGSGNNGFNVRCALYAESTSGGPGSLLKDFGATALTGTAGIHKAASSVTVSGPQMCYTALVSDSAAKLQDMSQLLEESSVGYFTAPLLGSLLGDISNAILTGGAYPVNGWYAAQTYGAFPATATAPTTSLVYMGTVPLMQLYL